MRKPIDISYYLLRVATIIELASTGGSEPVSNSTDLSDQSKPFSEANPWRQQINPNPIRLASGPDIQHSYT